MGVAHKCLLHIALGFNETVHGELRPAQVILSDRRCRFECETSFENSLRLRKFLLPAKNGAHAEMRRGKGPARQVDGFLKSVLGIRRVAQLEMRNAEIVIGFVVLRVLGDGLLQINETARGVALCEHVTALVKSLLPFASHSELLDGNDIIISRSRCLIGLRETGDRRNQNDYREKTAAETWVHGSAPSGGKVIPRRCFHSRKNASRPGTLSIFVWTEITGRTNRGGNCPNEQVGRVLRKRLGSGSCRRASEVAKKTLAVGN